MNKADWKTKQQQQQQKTNFCPNGIWVEEWSAVLQEGLLNEV